jgi:hypothetical protein
MEVLSQLSYAPTKNKKEILTKKLKKTSSAVLKQQANTAFHPIIFQTSARQSET